MKSFIIAMAIILMGTSGLVFRDDLTYYRLLQENLKHLTEECACYAAWALDFNENDISINEEEARDHVNTLIRYAQSFTPIFSGGHIECKELTLINEKTVEVRLRYISNKNFFRLRFVQKINEIEWNSIYYWES